MAFTLWFTGIPGSGKTTLARAVAETVRGAGDKIEILDGDEVRSIIGNTGFTKEERRKNVLSSAFTSLLLNRNGVSVVAAFVSPHEAAREEARKLVGPNFMEIFVDCPLSVCAKRDPKGLYRRQSEGTIKGLTGVDDPYESPVNPDLILKTETETIQDSLSKIMNLLKQKQLS